MLKQYIVPVLDCASVCMVAPLGTTMMGVVT